MWHAGWIARHLDPNHDLHASRAPAVPEALVAASEHLGTNEAMAREIVGGPWILQIGPVQWFDPLASVEAWIGSRGKARLAALGVVVPIVVALVLGRVFCGWGCPLEMLFDLNHRLRRRLSRWLPSLRRRPRTVPHPTKLAVLGFGLVFAAVAGASVLSLIYPPAILQRLAGGLTGWGTLGLLAAIFIVELLWLPRVWCTALCPGGALHALLGRFRTLRIVRTEGACVACPHCDRACPFDLEPSVRNPGMDCNNCGACIGACRRSALRHQLAWPWARS